MVKTTVVLDDYVYDKLVRDSKRITGKMRKISQTLNSILALHYRKSDSQYGATKAGPEIRRLMLKDLRDKHDRVY